MMIKKMILWDLPFSFSFDKCYALDEDGLTVKTIMIIY